MIDIRHWLLDAAVEFAIPLQVAGAPDVGEILNRKTHGVAIADLALCLDELIERGEIEFHTSIDGEEVRAHLCKEKIVRLLAQDRWSRSEPWCYALTRTGGTAWEKWAKPQWSRFNRSCSQDNLNWIGAANQRVASELLELEEPVRGDCTIIQGSIRHKVLRNWRATYWKTLPEGHLIRFRTKLMPKLIWTPMGHSQSARWHELRQFYLRPADCGF